MSFFDRLSDVFQDVFDDNELIISRDLSADDVVDWDSLTHVNLIVSVENEFSIRFSSSEVTRLKNVGELLDLIEAKT